MKIFCLLLISVFVFAKESEFEATIKPINKYIKQRMVERKSWHKGCPVEISDLRYIRLKHHTFYRGSKMGGDDRT